MSKLKLSKENYFVVSAHREENISNDENFNGLITSLNKIAEIYGLPIVFSTHPRTRNKLNESQIKLHPLIQIMKPLGFHDYNNLQKNAKVVLSDSGTISEEASIMRFSALNIREAHERPEAMEEASVMMTGLDIERVFQCIALIEHQPRGDARALNIVNDYSSNNISEKIVRIMHSYTDYVNRVVWKKY